MNELISVIIPIYAVELWLDECIQSVVNQSYKILEIILVDDGSPDQCPRICDEWARRDKRIRVIHKNNGGLSSARNAALDICTGQYISFVDSDDYIHKDMYKIMLEQLHQYDADVVRCSRFIVRDSQILEKNDINCVKSYNRNQMLDCYFYHKEDFCGGVWDKLYKAEIFNDVRFPEGINSEDYYVYAKIYNKINHLFFNNIPLYYYRIRENSICTSKEIDGHAYDKIKVSDMVKKYVDKNYPERSSDALAFQIICRYSIYYNLTDATGYEIL